ncbi:MAG: glycine zipper 2TM domain-containing protein [Rhodocyclaceae bacterium]|nr:glycine zipper 2TM domain-containing protein [Rhodocyclaceae bacterium]
MRTDHNASRLHPMAWLAALSVTAFSAVGIAAITGLIPTADSHQEIRAESRMVAAEASAPNPLAADREAPPATPSAHEAAVCAECGVIESVTPVRLPGAGSGAGAIAGGVVGGVIGNRVGKGLGRDLATIGGAVLGGFAGNRIEREVKTTTAYDVAVRLDDGQRRVVRVNGLPSWRAGDRVAVRGGVLTQIDQQAG